MGGGTYARNCLLYCWSRVETVWSCLAWGGARCNGPNERANEEQPARRQDHDVAILRLNELGTDSYAVLPTA